MLVEEYKQTSCNVIGNGPPPIKGFGNQPKQEQTNIFK